VCGGGGNCGRKEDVVIVAQEIILKNTVEDCDTTFTLKITHYSQEVQPEHSQSTKPLFIKQK
jgi:hypothetical protein